MKATVPHYHFSLVSRRNCGHTQFDQLLGSGSIASADKHTEATHLAMWTRKDRHLAMGPDPCPGFGLVAVARIDSWPSPGVRQTIWPDIECRSARDDSHWMSASPAIISSHPASKRLRVCPHLRQKIYRLVEITRVAECICNEGDRWMAPFPPPPDSQAMNSPVGNVLHKSLHAAFSNTSAPKLLPMR